MYWKVLQNGCAVDALTDLVYVRYLKKHNIVIACDRSAAQAILASDGRSVWHVYGLYRLPLEGFSPVEVIPIDEEAYQALAAELFSANPIGSVV